jgi:hypothetical protein
LAMSGGEKQASPSDEIDYGIIFYDCKV